MTEHKFLTIFIFDEPEAIAGQDWVIQYRVIERGSVPPVSDKNFAEYNNKPFNIHLNQKNRGFFQTKKNETFLALKKRILRIIVESERARRWWRRHMNLPVSLYAKFVDGESNILKLISSPQNKSENIKKQQNLMNYHNTKELQADDSTVYKSFHTTSLAEQKSQIMSLSQIDSQLKKKARRQESISQISSMSNDIEKNQELIDQVENFDDSKVQQRVQKVLDIIPEPVEPDLSDLDLECENEIDGAISDKNNDANQQQNEKQKEKDNKQRSPRMHPEDFPVWIGLLKKHDDILSDINKHTSPIQQSLEDPINAVGTELYPIFAPHAEMYALPPPPQLKLISNSEQQQISLHYPEFVNKAPKEYSSFKRGGNVESVGRTFCIGEQYNPFVKLQTKLKQEQKLANGWIEISDLVFQNLIQVQDNENPQLIFGEIMNKQKQNINIKEKYLPIMLILVPGKINIYEMQSTETETQCQQNNNTNQFHSSTNQKQIQVNKSEQNVNSHKSNENKSMCIVITQGRRILGQMTYPHKYPFISALRNITEFAVPLTLHKSDVIAYNEKGQKITQITGETQFEYERVFQPEIDEDEQEMEPQPLQQTQSLEISDQSTFQDQNDKVITQHNAQFYHISPQSTIQDIWKQDGLECCSLQRRRNTQMNNSSIQNIQLQKQFEKETEQEIDVDKENEKIKEQEQQCQNKNQQIEIHKYFENELSLEKQRRQKLANIASWSSGKLVQNSIHTSPAFAGEYNIIKSNFIEYLKQDLQKIDEQYIKYVNQLNKITEQKKLSKKLNKQTNDTQQQKPSQQSQHKVPDVQIDDKDSILNSKTSSIVPSINSSQNSKISYQAQESQLDDIEQTNFGTNQSQISIIKSYISENSLIKVYMGQIYKEYQINSNIGRQLERVNKYFGFIYKSHNGSITMEGIEWRKFMKSFQINQFYEETAQILQNQLEQNGRNISFIKNQLEKEKEKESTAQLHDITQQNSDSSTIPVNNPLIQQQLNLCRENEDKEQNEITNIASDQTYEQNSSIVNNNSFSQEDIIQHFQPIKIAPSSKIKFNQTIPRSKLEQLRKKMEKNNHPLTKVLMEQSVTTNIVGSQIDNKQKHAHVKPKLMKSILKELEDIRFVIRCLILFKQYYQHINISELFLPSELLCIWMKQNGELSYESKSEFGINGLKQFFRDNLKWKKRQMKNKKYIEQRKQFEMNSRNNSIQQLAPQNNILLKQIQMFYPKIINRINSTDQNIINQLQDIKNNQQKNQKQFSRDKIQLNKGLQKPTEQIHIECNNKEQPCKDTIQSLNQELNQNNECKRNQQNEETKEKEKEIEQDYEQTYETNIREELIKGEDQMNQNQQQEEKKVDEKEQQIDEQNTKGVEGSGSIGVTEEIYSGKQGDDNQEGSIISSQNNNDDDQQSFVSELQIQPLEANEFIKQSFQYLLSLNPWRWREMKIRENENKIELEYEPPERVILSVDVLAVAVDCIISDIQHVLYNLIDFQLHEEDVKIKRNIFLNPQNKIEKSGIILNENKRKQQNSSSLQNKNDNFELSVSSESENDVIFDVEDAKETWNNRSQENNIQNQDINLDSSQKDSIKRNRSNSPKTKDIKKHYRSISQLASIKQKFQLESYLSSNEQEEIKMKIKQKKRFKTHYLSNQFRRKEKIFRTMEKYEDDFDNAFTVIKLYWYNNKQQNEQIKPQQIINQKKANSIKHTQKSDDMKDINNIKRIKDENQKNRQFSYERMRHFVRQCVPELRNLQQQCNGVWEDGSQIKVALERENLQNNIHVRDQQSVQQMPLTKNEIDNPHEVNIQNEEDNKTQELIHLQKEFRLLRHSQRLGLASLPEVMHPFTDPPAPIQPCCSQCSRNGFISINSEIEIQLEDMKKYNQNIQRNFQVHIHSHQRYFETHACSTSSRDVQALFSQEKRQFQIKNKHSNISINKQSQLHENQRQLTLITPFQSNLQQFPYPSSSIPSSDKVEQTLSKQSNLDSNKANLDSILSESVPEEQEVLKIKPLCILERDDEEQNIKLQSLLDILDPQSASAIIKRKQFVDRNLSKKYYSGSFPASTFGNQNKIFDIRIPIYRFGTYRSFLGLSFKTRLNLNDNINQHFFIGLPVEIDKQMYLNQLKNLINQRINNNVNTDELEQLKQVFQFENSGIGGWISVQQTLELKSTIYQMIYSGNYLFNSIFSQEEIYRFLDLVIRFYYQHEQNRQHYNIQVYFGEDTQFEQVKPKTQHKNTQTVFESAFKDIQTQTSKRFEHQKFDPQINIKQVGLKIPPIDISGDSDEEIDIIKAEERYKQGLLVVGDIHGNFSALIKVLAVVDEVLLLNSGKKGKVVFLGDYIDRGQNSLECIILLLAYKLAFPSRIVLLRGNHDDQVYSTYFDKNVMNQMNRIVSINTQLKIDYNLNIYRTSQKQQNKYKSEEQVL